MWLCFILSSLNHAKCIKQETTPTMYYYTNSKSNKMLKLIKNTLCPFFTCPKYYYNNISFPALVMKLQKKVTWNIIKGNAENLLKNNLNCAKHFMYLKETETVAAFTSKAVMQHKSINRLFVSSNLTAESGTLSLERYYLFC